MDELLVAVLLRHHPLTAPHHLVELLRYAMQRQAVELTAQRSCGSFYRRSFSLSLSLTCFPFFVSGSLCALLCWQLASFLMPFMLGVFCPLSLSACARRPRFKRAADAMSAVDSIYLCVSL